MRSYTVTPLHTEVPAWEEIPALQVDNVLWLPDSGVRMTQQLCYDAKYLYVRQQAWEQRIRAQRTGYLQQVCEDSCMEFFFAPLGEERYFNLEINPNGCVRLGFGTAEGPRTQLVPRDKVNINYELYYVAEILQTAIIFPGSQSRNSSRRGLRGCAGESRQSPAWSARR